MRNRPEQGMAEEAHVSGLDAEFLVNSEHQVAIQEVDTVQPPLDQFRSLILPVDELSPAVLKMAAERT